jgi:glycosyltransferase involved in cell wall biosynthesis
MKMCNAFGLHGYVVDLFAYRGNSATDVYRYYGVSRCFDIREIRNSALPGVRRLLRAGNGALLHTGGGRPDLIYGRDLYSLLAASVSGVPVIFEAHTAPSSVVDRYLTARLLKRKNLLRLVVISSALARDYVSLYPWFDEQRVVVAHDGADEPVPNASTRLAAWPGRPDKVQAGYVGSLFPGKGAEVVTELARRLPDIDFHIVGGDPAEVHKVRESFPGTNLFMHGYVEHSKVPEYMACMDIALLPPQKNVHVSRTIDIGSWMSPLKLFEYMAAKLPIVGSALPVVEEVLKNNVNAILVPPEDLDSWTRGVHELARDRELRARLALQAYTDFTSSYTWAGRSERVLQGVEITSGCRYRAS